MQTRIKFEDYQISEFPRHTAKIIFRYDQIEHLRTEKINIENSTKIGYYGSLVLELILRILFYFLVLSNYSGWEHIWIIILYFMGIEIIIRILNPLHILPLLGELFFYLKKYDLALRIYNFAIKFQRPSDEFLVNYGIILSQLNQVEEAIEVYLVALKINFNYKYAWGNLAHALYYLDRYEDLIEIQRKITDFYPDDSIYLAKIAHSYHETGWLGSAIDTYLNVIDLNDTDVAFSWHNLGLIFEDKKRREEAEEAYKNAISIQPDLVEAWNSLGILMFNLEKYEEAENAYRKAIEYQSDYDVAWYNLACLYSQKNQPEESLQYLVKAISYQSTKCENQNLAKEDQSFDNIRDLPEFKEITDCD